MKNLPRTEPMRRNIKVKWRVVEAYLTRCRVEDTIRFIKQSYDFEDVRVLSCQRLKSMAVLVLAASYVIAGSTFRIRSVTVFSGLKLN